MAAVRDQEEEHEEQLAGTLRIFTETNAPQTEGHILLLPPPSDSPNDPLKWSLARKAWSASLVLFITALTAATSNGAGSAGTVLNDDYGISWDAQNTAAGVLFVGIGYCTLLLSSAPWLYGRRVSYLICLLFSIIGAAWFASIETTQDQIWCQLFVGASESVAEATVQLSLSDVFFQHQRGSVLGIYVLATSIGTFLGPLITGYIADSQLGWRWIGWFSVIISAATFVVFYFGLEETAFERNTVVDGVSNSRPQSQASPDTVGDPEKKICETAVPVVVSSEKRGHVIPNANDMTPKSYRDRIALITFSPTVIGTGFKQYFRRMWYTLRIFYFPAVVYSGIQWGAQDAWLTFYLTVQDDNWTEAPYNYGDAADAIMNVPTLIGAVIGCIYGGWFSDVFVHWMAKRNGGISEAEHRLWLMYPPAIISPIGLIIFGVGTDREWPWPAPYVALGLIGFGWGCAGDLSMAYLQDCYPVSQPWVHVSRYMANTLTGHGPRRHGWSKRHQQYPGMHLYLCLLNLVGCPQRHRSICYHWYPEFCFHACFHDTHAVLRESFPKADRGQVQSFLVPQRGAVGSGKKRVTGSSSRSFVSPRNQGDCITSINKSCHVQ